MSNDSEVYLSHHPDWEKTDLQWSVVPWGFRKMLNWIADRYPGLPLYVTENGCAVAEPDVTTAKNDEFRCHFMSGYIDAMKEAILVDGNDVRGYFVWSLIDNFESAFGYSKRLGLIRCDFNTLERIPKKSYYHYRKIIEISHLKG
ncbi:MAG: family 1 glycosylhydrolase [Lentisphaerota bacterium]